MRITVVSNLFPPLCVGGYEIGAARIVQELHRRGYPVQVLTAQAAWLPQAGRLKRHAHADPAHLIDIGPCVLDSLAKMPWRAPGLLLEALLARRRCRATLDAFAPDLVMLFNPLGLLAPVFQDAIKWARCRGVRTVAYVSDRWLADWPLAHPVGRLQARLGLSGPERPQADYHVYCSRYLRQASGGHDSDAVVPWGLPDVEALLPQAVESFRNREPLALVYAGQIEPHKGLDVLLHALASCHQPHRLTVVGDHRTAYAGDCRQLAIKLGMASRVSFVGKQPPDAMRALLPKLGRVLVVPSVWQEPFSLVVLEGMAAGLTVVASRTGGTPEAIADRQTGFLFDPGNPAELTTLLDQLEEDRDLAWRIGSAAQEVVRQRFRIEDIVDGLLRVGQAPKHADTIGCKVSQARSARTYCKGDVSP